MTSRRDLLKRAFGAIGAAVLIPEEVAEALAIAPDASRDQLLATMTPDEIRQLWRKGMSFGEAHEDPYMKLEGGCDYVVTACGSRPTSCAPEP